jgi:small-conductance mechanosensitive channel
MNLQLLWNWSETPIQIGLVILLAIVARFVLRRMILMAVGRSVALANSRREHEGVRAERILRGLGGLVSTRHEARVRTLGSIGRNVIDVTLLVVATLTILATLGIPLGPILTGAGIGGVAFGFGAQSLVKDYMTGVFMLMEDQYGVGDHIDTGEVIGTVEEVGLRVTRLRDDSGQVWYVRNGEITRIGNLSQGHSTGTIDVPVAYNEDTARALELLNKVVDEVWEDDKWTNILLERPSVAGVNAVTGTTMTLRIFAKCAPNKHWGVQRDILERAQQALSAAGVRGPLLVPQSGDHQI